jgi:hypothetical protein
MGTSRFVRVLSVVGLAAGVVVAAGAVAPAGASPGSGRGHEGSWYHGGSRHLPPGHPPPGHLPPGRTAVCSGSLATPGVLAGTYPGNVVVSGFCAVDGGPAVVLGNLTVSPGSGLDATFALNDVTGAGSSSLTVRGSLLVQSGAVLGLGCEPTFSPCSDDPDAATGGTLTSAGHVGGDLDAEQALGVIVHASTIGGNVVEHGGGGGVGCTVPATGIFSLLGSPVFSDYEDNAIGGNLLVQGLQTCWLGALRNTVRGSAAVLGNTFADPDADEVVSNTVHGSLACFGNSPAVQFGDSSGTPDRVGGWAFGECAFGVTQPDPAANLPTTPGSSPPYYPAGPPTPISVKL